MGTRPTTTRSAAWSWEDLYRFAATTVLAIVVCILGWYLASSEAVVTDQYPWVNLGVAGLILAGYAQVTLLIRIRRRVVARRAELMAAARDHVAARAMDPVGAAEPRDGLVAAEGLRYFHRPSCAMAQGRAMHTRSRDDHQDAGRLPCGLCVP